MQRFVKKKKTEKRKNRVKWIKMRRKSKIKNARGRLNERYDRKEKERLYNKMNHK